MLEEFIWNFFTQTGSIETFLEYTKTRDLNAIDNGNKDIRNDN
ncbi:MAG: hypothetical protein UH854_01090 [Clostridia bacterium]|nr:hypothetical protein [Clostridia bacterium]